MRSLLFVVVLASLASFSAGCNRHGSAGESCEAPGLEDPNAIGQCAAGFVCTPDESGLDGNGQSPHWDVSTCRSECTSSTECPDGETCRTVPGSEYRMSCQPN